MRDWDVTPDPLLVSWSRYGYCVLDLVSYRPCKELKDQSLLSESRRHPDRDAVLGDPR